MILTNSLLWFDPISIVIGIAAFLFFSLTIAWKHKNLLGLTVLRYKGIQRIHVKETPRLGGLIIILALWLYVLLMPLLESKAILQLMLISLIPCLFIALREDLFHDMKPRVRLISLLITAELFLFLYKAKIFFRLKFKLFLKFFIIFSIKVKSSFSSKVSLKKE